MAIRILSSENISGEVLIASGKYLSWGTAGAASIEGSTVSNKLQFRTNSTDAMIIDSSQNVGIGTITPATFLQVSGQGNRAGGNIQMGLSSQGANKWSYLTGTHYNSTSEPEGFALIGGYSTINENRVVIGGDIYETNPATSIHFWTHSSSTHAQGGTERMRIANTLITFPTVTELRGDIASDKFAIGNMGDGSSQMMVSSRGFLTFNVSNTGSALDATERMRIGSNGYVGMGIDNTNNQRITLAEADANGSHIKMNNSRTGGGYWVNGVGDDGSTASIVPPGGIFWYNGATRMVIDSSGNVGIGTASPSTPLMVNRASNSNEPGIYYDVTGGGSGSVGIGSTAAFGPFIVGNTLPNGNVRGAYSASRMLFNGGGFSFQTSDETSGARTFDDKVKIEIGGNVGIGTTSPSSYQFNAGGGGNTSLVIAGGGAQGMSIAGSINAKIVFFKNTTPQCFIQSGIGSGGSGQMEFFTNGTGATRTMKLLTTGQVNFEQYGSGSYTGTAAYNLSVDSSGNIIETSGGGGGLTPALVEQTWTFTRAELNAGFGGSGYTLIAAPGGGTTGSGATYVVIEESYWMTTGTATSNSSLQLEARQDNQIPGVQTVTRVNSTQWNYMTNNNSGNGMLYRPAVTGAAVVRAYLPGAATTLHKLSGSTLPSGFTNLKLKIIYKLFTSANI